MCILSLIAWLCHILKNVQWVIIWIFVFHVSIGISEHKAIKLRFSHDVKSVSPFNNGHAFRFPEGFLCIANQKVLMLSRKDSSWILIANEKPSSHQCFQVIGWICGSYIAQITCISKSGILLSVIYLVRIVIKKQIWIGISIWLLQCCCVIYVESLIGCNISDTQKQPERCHQVLCEGFMLIAWEKGRGTGVKFVVLV